MRSCASFLYTEVDQLKFLNTNQERLLIDGVNVLAPQLMFANHDLSPVNYVIAFEIVRKVGGAPGRACLHVFYSHVLLLIR